jgi:ring-1,2-phenylacetyl-CoA epoxidase subunit PaaE
MTTAFHSLRVAEVRKEISDAVSVRFDVPTELADVFRFKPGQHLTLKADIDGEEVRRNYSICVAPDDGELRVAIKRVNSGVFSNWANESLQVGDTLDIMQPHGSFTWAFSPERAATYVGFAGGSGITPVLSLVKTGLAAEPTSRFVLFYGNRNTRSIMFLEQIAALKDRYMDRLQVYHVLEEEEGEFELLNGRLDADKLSALIGPVIDTETVDAAFICGPGPMMDAVEAALRSAGVAEERILIERFQVGELSEARKQAARELEQKANGRRIKVVIDGRRRVLDYSADRGSILENARAAGMPAPFACKAGVCATCRAKVTAGKVEMIQNFGLTRDDLAQGYVLTCQAIPLTDDVGLDFDA